MKTFSEVAVAYLASRVVSKHYETSVTRVAAACGTMTVEAVNAYLKRRLGEVQAATVKSERTILLGLWRGAYEDGIVEAMPRGIVKIKVPRKPTAAWTQEQCKLIVEKTFEKTEKLRSGVTLGDFLRAWTLLGYEAGARRGDLFSLRKEHFHGDSLRWTQSKTGDPITKVLSEACLEAVNLMLKLSPDGSVLGWCCGGRQAMRLMKKHLKSCGIDGTSKWLRRSGATHIELEQPGMGRLHLGHRTVGLAEKHYLDWSQIRRNTPKTPALLK